MLKIYQAVINHERVTLMKTYKIRTLKFMLKTYIYKIGKNMHYCIFLPIYNVPRSLT